MSKPLNCYEKFDKGLLDFKINQCAAFFLSWLNDYLMYFPTWFIPFLVSRQSCFFKVIVYIRTTHTENHLDLKLFYFFFLNMKIILFNVNSIAMDNYIACIFKIIYALFHSTNINVLKPCMFIKCHNKSFRLELIYPYPTPYKL